ncbi:hypothetical protein LCGC14_2284020, partial [marine sediment metagenome]
MQKLKWIGQMYIAPPQVASSFQPQISIPVTSGAPGTTGVTLDPGVYFITPENRPTTLTSVVAGAASMFLFGWGWNNVAGSLARVQMPSVSPADKKALSQSRWNGAFAAMALGGALFLAPSDYKRWALVGGLPLTSYFLPGLIRGGLFGFWGAKKTRVVQEQRRSRTKQQKLRRKKG